MYRVRPVILSGGSGTRLWPVSRKNFPKQFANLVGQDNLFAGTLKTVADRSRFLPPMIIGSVVHKFLVQDAFERLGLSDATVLLEPFGRNTAVAAIVAALAEKALPKDDGPKVLHLVMPSDHIIADKAGFASALATAQTAAESGQIVLFGINPTRPDTGFGYILRGHDAAQPGVQTIARFCEKPDTDSATRLIAEGALWNSGIFFYDPALVLAEAARLMPNDLALCREAMSHATEDYRARLLDEEMYGKLGNEPFDRAIMEKTDKGAVVACDMAWSDLGSWEALWQIEEKDGRGNACVGSVVARDIDGCYVRSYGPTVSVMGVTDLAIVATKDSVLVTPRDRSQEVREMVDVVKEENGTLALDHPCVRRPWGSFEGIAKGSRYQVKHIVVLPGRSLSDQMHHHRAEHWVVVQGTAKVEIDGEEKLVFPNESVYIPGGARHRLSNPGKVDLHLIEVQSGDYLGEDDIVRFDDNYGRVDEEQKS